ncbi:MAG: hypothetical protein HS130_00915 [Deltaproteobacteria bacterium]|nr:hypothetical protein [Deltaproteobacteria bacterium]MCL4873852.1 hypothetical protein [bacterium]
MPQRKKTNKKDEQPVLDRSISYRTLAVAVEATGAPASLDEGTRSVEVVGATENPVPVWDWERWEMVPEVLLMDGCELPGTGQVPLLENHYRFSTSDVLGSYRGMKIEGGKLIGRAHFSEVEESQKPYQKVREGHLTDFSIGYRIHEATYIPAGEKQTVNGRTYQGPVKIATRWTPKELSITPIGADEEAKVRAAAAPGHINAKQEEEMDKKVREYLESRGLKKDASEEEAYRFLEKLEMRKEEPPAQPAGGGDDAAKAEAARLEGARAEQSRIIEIRSMCEQAGCPEEVDAFIKGNKPVEEARKAMFDKVTGKAQAATGDMGVRAPITHGKDEKEKFRAAAEDSLILRSGILRPGKTIEKPADGARDLMGFSLRELAREHLRLSRLPIHGNVLEMVGRALTTSDFPILLANVANKSLFEGWETEEETWQIWCGEGSVSDFKTHTSARASETDDLDEIREEDEYKHGSMTEGKEEYKVATYGKLFKLSRQTIINDDLNALVNIPFKHGEAAARKIGDIAYAVLTANSAMGDGVALFHSNHKNLGTSGVVSETTMAEGELLMGTQKDLNDKRRLNISPAFFIAPRALKGAAEVFFGSNQFAGDNKSATRTNPYAGTKYTRVYEARLDDDSATAWYLAARKGKTVTVFFLNGQKAPYLETKQGWNVDGVEYKVRIDAGAKAMDWKGLLKNAGA